MLRATETNSLLTAFFVGMAIYMKDPAVLFFAAFFALCFCIAKWAK